MTKKKTSKSTKNRKPKSFVDQVRVALTRKWQSSREIAAKVGLAGPDGEPTPYHKAKTLAALRDLGDKVEQKGAFKTAMYRKAA